MNNIFTNKKIYQMLGSQGPAKPDPSTKASPPIKTEELKAVTVYGNKSKVGANDKKVLDDMNSGGRSATSIKDATEKYGKKAVDVSVRSSNADKGLYNKVRATESKSGGPTKKEPKRVKIESEGMDGQGSTEYIRGGRDGDKNARSVTIEKDYSGEDQKVVRRKKKDGTVKTKSKKISSKRAERIKKRKDKSHTLES